MGVIRNSLLAAAENRSLRERMTRLDFVRQSVSRFMPGERLEDALAAAAALKEQRIGAVLTELGENVTDPSEADRVVRHYADVLASSHDRGLDCDISIKLTQLGLALDRERCHVRVRSLVEQAKTLGSFVWIDMEQSAYVDSTLAVYRRVRSAFPNVGVCVQAYLYRTADDVASLIPLGGGIRLVKGAYREPSSMAYPRRREVDGNFLLLATRLISPEARAAGLRAVFGTHDLRMIKAIQDHAAGASVSRDAFEFHLLFGIQRALQRRLAAEGYRVRVLISYGREWFPWYMRRLAERPANMLFLVKSLFSH
jgi:proline dehydrogenase